LGLWCDAECVENGDCCFDVCAACTEDSPETCGECVPDCTDLACGDDGCGGSCGTCEGGGSCDAGVSLPPGDVCEAALVLTAGQPTAGDLGTFVANYTLDEGGYCAEDAETDTPGVDALWRFTAPAEGWFDVVATPDAADLTLWAAAGCDELALSCAAT